MNSGSDEGRLPPKAGVADGEQCGYHDVTGFLALDFLLGLPSL